MRVGCFGPNTDFTASRLVQAKSILARQHDDPVLLIPAGIESDGVQGKVRMGNLLSGVLISIAVLVDHDSFSTFYRSFHNFKRFFSFTNSI